MLLMLYLTIINIILNIFGLFFHPSFPPLPSYAIHKGHNGPVTFAKAVFTLLPLFACFSLCMED